MMPGCLLLIAAILMHKFPGSVKLICPENQCHIMRRLVNWKHKYLAYQGNTYSLESNQLGGCRWPVAPWTLSWKESRDDTFILI